MVTQPVVILLAEVPWVVTQPVVILLAEVPWVVTQPAEEPWVVTQPVATQQAAVSRPAAVPPQATHHSKHAPQRTSVPETRCA